MKVSFKCAATCTYFELPIRTEYEYTFGNKVDNLISLSNVLNESHVLFEIFRREHAETLTKILSSFK